RPVRRGEARRAYLGRRPASPVRHAGRGRRDRRPRMTNAVPEAWRLDGRVARVSGAHPSIGLARAAALARARPRVACVAVPGGRLEAGVERLGPPAAAHPADLAQSDDAAELGAEVVRAYGRLDALVNAAGTLPPAPFLEMTPDQWDRPLDVNTRGALFLA